MPSIFAAAIARIRALFRRDVVAGEIHDELQFHQQMRVEEYEQRGCSKEDAQRIARARIGNLAVHQDRGYDIRGGGVMERVLQDVRYTIRLWRRQPGFAAVAMLTLGIGIGLSSALFSVIDAALLRPLPFPHPEQLISVDIETRDAKGRNSRYAPSLIDARDWRAGSRTLSAVGMIRDFPMPILVDAGGGPERIDITRMGEGCLDVYLTTPFIGRELSETDLAVGASPVVLLGYDYWRRRFGADASAIGKTIRLLDASTTATGKKDTSVLTIIGVLPKGFYESSSLWLPHQIWSAKALASRGNGASVYARMRPGMTLPAAVDELTDIARRAAAARGESIDFRVSAKSLLAETTSGTPTTFTVLSYAVGFILLIACINVAGLLLARGSARQQELAIRASVGAGRARLVQQLLTESAMLGVAGAALGAVLAGLSLDALVSILPLRLPTSASVALNYRVLSATLALAFGTSIAFGLFPALKLSISGFGSGNRLNQRHTQMLSRRSGQALIGAEVALAIVLLAGAGLMIRSLVRTLAVDVGFDPSTVITMEIAPIDQTPEQMQRYYAELLDTIRAMPGVAAASAIDNLPMGRSMNMTSVQVDGAASVMMVRRQPLPGYLEAMGQSLKQGHIPDDHEIASSAPLVVINETAANKLFPTGSAIGKTIAIANNERQEVAAVVGNIRQSGPLYSAEPEIITFLKGPVSRPLTVIVRPAPGVHIPDDRLREAAMGVGPQVFVERIRSGSDWVGDQVLNPRHRTLLFSLLGALGLMLTLVGIFAATAYAVARRTREIGVRMAFGAQPAQAVSAIVLEALWPLMIGSAVGLGAAVLSTKVIAKFLFQTAPTDPVAFASVVVILIGAGTLAAWLPARKAARIDPVTALRAE